MTMAPVTAQPMYIKAGFFGWQGSGKTYTASELAIFIRKYFGLAGPIAFFDTEKGSLQVREKIEKATGKPLMGKQSRSLKDLIEAGEWCLKNGVSVLIVDSITHVWLGLCKFYLEQDNAKIRRRNEFRKRAGEKELPEKKKLDALDYVPIKDVFRRWSDFYINAPLHIIVCGRAAVDWGNEQDEDTGKRKLVNLGSKMKTEGEFGYEPDLLVEMERAGKGQVRAMVLKDRYDVINGAECINPKPEFFLPIIKRLAPKGQNMEVGDGTPVDFGLDDESRTEQRQRKVLFEEIEAELEMHFNGRKADEKKQKLEVLNKVFGTKSMTAIESKGVKELREGLQKLRCELYPEDVQVEEKPAAGTNGKPKPTEQQRLANDLLYTAQTLQKAGVDERVCLQLAGATVWDEVFQMDTIKLKRGIELISKLKPAEEARA